MGDNYRTVVTACVNVARGTGIFVWGIRDSDSWRSSGTPPLDGGGNEKAAYNAVLSALGTATPTSPATSSSSPTTRFVAAGEVHIG